MMTRTTNEFGDLVVESAEFGDRRKHKKHKRSYYGVFGNATKKKLKRPYLRKVVREGRKLINKRKIGKVEKSARNKFAYVTRGGSVWEANVSKKSGGRKPAKRKAAKKAHRKPARKK